MNDARQILPPRTVALLAGLAVALGLLMARDAPGLAFLFERTLTVTMAMLPGALVVLACLCLGFALMPVRTWAGATCWETALFSLGCGAGIMSCVVLALGLAGWLNAALMWGVVTGCIGAGGIRALTMPACRNAGTLCLPEPRPIFLHEAVLLVLVVAAAALYAVSALAPPLLYDVTEYHLGAFRDYSRSGPSTAGFIAMPHNFYARFPFPIESLYYLGLCLESPADFAPKAIHAAFLAGCVLLAWAWMRRARIASPWRLLACLLFLAHPMVLEVSLDAYIDGAVAFLVTASVFAALLGAGLMNDDRPAGGAALLPVAGLLFGTALAAKYTVAQIYLLPAMLFVLPGVIGAVRRERAWGRLALAVALCCVPPLFWLGKNVFFYGNPLEPFFVSVFRPGDAAAIAREKYYIDSHYPQSFLSASYWATLPVRVGAVGWPVLLLMPFVAFARRRPDLRMLGFCAVSLLMWNLVRESQARFLAPVFLVSSILVARVVDGLPAGAARGAVALLLAVYACGHLALHAVRIGKGGEFGYATRVALTRPPADSGIDDPRVEFLRNNLGSIGKAAAAVNLKLPRRANILMVYEARPYLFERRTVYNTVFDDSVLLAMARGAASGGEIAAKLKEAGITHVLVNREELRRFIDQYARPEQLRRAGIERPMEQFHLLATPEDLYPPFGNSPSWAALRTPVLEFLAVLRARATVVEGTAPAEVFLAPL